MTAVVSSVAGVVTGDSVVTGASVVTGDSVVMGVSVCTGGSDEMTGSGKMPVVTGSVVTGVLVLSQEASVTHRTSSAHNNIYLFTANLPIWKY